MALNAIKLHAFSLKYHGIGQ